MNGKKKKIEPITDMNSFTFRNTLVGKFYDKMNKPKKVQEKSPNKVYLGEGPFGSMFTTKK
tara:strand:+ start:435 stop:617 length:183 start_codon:yes stop_codon:yes gene_type:complete